MNKTGTDSGIGHDSDRGAAIVLDLVGLAPPEPMVRILEALDTLTSHQNLRVLLDREPHPLLRVLERHGHAWRGSTLADGRFELVIEAVPVAKDGA